MLCMTDKVQSHTDKVKSVERILSGEETKET